MIIIKAENEAEVVAKIESALKGQEIEMAQTEDDEFSIEQALMVMGYNTLRARQYIGRLVRNTEKQEQTTRQTNTLLAPLSQYFSILLQEKQEEIRKEVRAMKAATATEKALQDQRDISERLAADGKLPKE